MPIPGSQAFDVMSRRPTPDAANVPSRSAHNIPAPGSPRRHAGLAAKASRLSGEIERLRALLRQHGSGPEDRLA